MSLFSLDELERQFREHQHGRGERTRIIAMQVPESEAMALRTKLEARQSSLSEHVRDLLRKDSTRAA